MPAPCARQGHTGLDQVGKRGLQPESILCHDSTHLQTGLHYRVKLQLRGHRLGLRSKEQPKYISCTDVQVFLALISLFSGGVTAGACKPCQAGTYSISSGRVCPDSAVSLASRLYFERENNPVADVVENNSNILRNNQKETQFFNL